MSDLTSPRDDESAAQIGALSERVINLTSINSSLRQQIVRLESGETLFLQWIRAVQTQNTLLDQRIHPMMEQNTSLRQEVRAQEDQIASLQQQMAAVDAQNTSLREQMAARDAQNTSLQQQIGPLNEENRFLQQWMRGLGDIDAPELDGFRSEVDEVKSEAAEPSGPTIQSRFARLAEMWASRDKPAPPREIKPRPLTIGRSGESVSEAPRKHECPVTGRGKGPGVIAFLTKQYGGNVHTRNVVTVTARSASTDPEPCSPEFCVDLRESRPFKSENAPGQRICWYFRHWTFSPSDIRITGTKMHAWVVEGKD
jgi:hypothetical protein